MTRNKTPLHGDVIYISGQKDDAMAEVAFQYNDGYNENIVSFANNVHTPVGGMHETGLQDRPDPGAQQLRGCRRAF